MLTLVQFENRITNLHSFYQKALKLDKIFGAEISNDGLIGDMLNAYGALIIDSFNSELSDNGYMDFWDLIIKERLTYQDITDFYNKYFLC